MVKIYTAQYRYSGPHRLDVTVKGNDPLGSVFAPSWSIVRKYMKDKDESAYTNVYHKMMLDSYAHNRQAWEQVLGMEVVVLVCFCPSGSFCHRRLLAGYLAHLGGTYAGEIGVNDTPTP